MIKTILVLGNGFDLAMGRSTQYKDFLKFVNVFQEKIEKKSDIQKLKQFGSLGTIFTETNSTEPNFEKNIKTFLQIQEEQGLAKYSRNSIIDYIKFIKNTENWSDLEHRISDLAEAIDYFRENLEEYSEVFRVGKSYKHFFKEEFSFEEKNDFFTDIYEALSLLITSPPLSREEAEDVYIEEIERFEELENAYREKIKNFQTEKNYYGLCFVLAKILSFANYGETEPHSELIEKINQHFISELQEITLLLELYLINLDYEDYKLNNKDYIPKNIKDFRNGNTVLSVLHKSHDDNWHKLWDIRKSYIITFNYTHTAEQLLKISNDNIHHVHGSIRSVLKGTSLDNFLFNNLQDNSNLVFGIEDQNIENINSNLIEYQKFYQRILKQTGSNYETFFQKIENDFEENRDDNNHLNIIIFGHSVDPIDKEIFLNIFDLAKRKEKDYKFIFTYHDDKAKKSIVKNLAIILGKPRLIELSGENRIVFIKADDQKTMADELRRNTK